MDTSPIDSSFVDHFKAMKVFDDHQPPKCDNKLSKYETDLKKNDIYLRHRREALEFARLASLHFKDAKEAYLRGAHSTAKEYSMKAREELDISRELNSKAAKKILEFKNNKNKICRLDLHGLHAAEALQALKERLDKIENEGFQHVYSTLTKPVRHLQVITGVGKHSQGKPVLPTAVRNFLNQNSYRFEEARPGLLKVWPNFHLQCNHNIQVLTR